jgi:hypothetical protein
MALRRRDHADDQPDDDQYSQDAHRCLPYRIQTATLTRGRRLQPSAFHKLEHPPSNQRRRSSRALNRCCSLTDTMFLRLRHRLYG